MIVNYFDLHVYFIIRFIGYASCESEISTTFFLIYVYILVQGTQ